VNAMRVTQLLSYTFVFFKLLPIYFLAYTGDQCQFSKCNNQPDTCLKDFGLSLCSDPKIGSYFFNKCLIFLTFYHLN
jgi:hypothetical protein